MASETTRDEQKSIDDLIMEIVNVPEGYTCFLCSTTSGDECIWYELKDDIVSVGNAAMTLEKDKMPNLTLAEAHTAARYACYRRYIFTAGSWVTKRRRIRLPKCVEAEIKRSFPGDGVYVGYKSRPGYECDDK